MSKKEDDKLNKVKKSDLLNQADKIIYESDLLTHLKEEVEKDNIKLSEIFYNKRISIVKLIKGLV